MLKLKPLLVVTGTIRVGGGEKNTVRQQEATTKDRGDHLQVTITQHRSVSKDRMRGNVISTAFMRRLRGLRALKTPFGSLCEIARLRDVKVLLDEATAAARDFNATVSPDSGCRLSNCMLWERLTGNRLAAVEGWLARQIADGDEDLEKSVAPLLDGAA